MTGGLRRVAAVSSRPLSLWTAGHMAVGGFSEAPVSGLSSKRQTQGRGGRNQRENSNFTTQGSNVRNVFVACSMTVLLL